MYLLLADIVHQVFVAAQFNGINCGYPVGFAVISCREEFEVVFGKIVVKT